MRRRPGPRVWRDRQCFHRRFSRMAGCGRWTRAWLAPVLSSRQCRLPLGGLTRRSEQPGCVKIPRWTPSPIRAATGRGLWRDGLALQRRNSMSPRERLPRSKDRPRWTRSRVDRDRFTGPGNEPFRQDGALGAQPTRFREIGRVSPGLRRARQSGSFSNSHSALT